MESKDRLVTARVHVTLPFRTSVKEGDLYELIEKTLNNTTKITIYPLEYIGTKTHMENGNYVSNFRRVRLDVTRSISRQVTNFSDREVRRPFMDEANSCLNLFLLHCRTKSKQFWLPALYLNDFNKTRFQYEVQFVGEHDDILYAEGGTIGGLEPMGTGINKEVWEKIKNDIIHDVEPSVVDYHIEEARDAIFSKSVQILLINTAVALEIFTSRFCFEYACKTGKGTEAEYKRLSESKGNTDSFVVKYYKKLIPYLTANNLDKDKYDEIDYLFRARNKVAHEGKALYKDKHGTECLVDVECARRFFVSAIEVMEWLRNMDSDTADTLKCFVDTR